MIQEHRQSPRPLRLLRVPLRLRPTPRSGPSPSGRRQTVAIPVAASALSASTAAPAATFSCDCGVVTTGARSRVDSCCVTSGMFAPPPTVATAEMSDSAMLLRCNVSSTVFEETVQRFGDELFQLGARHADIG